MTVHSQKTIDLGQVKLEMIYIPGGSFLMGSPEDELGRCSDEGPQHQVTVARFWMSKYPITQAQWRAVACLPQVNRPLHPNLFRFRGDKRPMDRVSWFDAVEFCDRLSKKSDQPYTLPSEAQWEYVCRAGTTTPFHFGETLSNSQANLGGRETAEVSDFPPNGWGLSGMHGNVWEWCLDHWHESYEGAPTDGSAWVTGGDSNRRVLRGGSWYDTPRLCRSACRNSLNPDDRLSHIGFRVVCVPHH